MQGFTCFYCRQLVTISHLSKKYYFYEKIFYHEKLFFVKNIFIAAPQYYFIILGVLIFIQLCVIMSVNTWLLITTSIMLRIYLAQGYNKQYIDFAAVEGAHLTLMLASQLTCYIVVLRTTYGTIHMVVLVQNKVSGTKNPITVPLKLQNFLCSWLHQLQLFYNDMLVC